MSEKFATLGTSTLNGGIDSAVTSLVLTSALTFSSSGTFDIRIDNEIMEVTAVSGNTFTVVRAQGSTIAAAHSDLATVAQIVTARAFAQWQSDILGLAAQAAIPGGKLTLTSGTPVTTGDISGASSVYYTPFRSNVVALWDGAYWQRFTFSELTLALGTVTVSLPYDVFLFISGGVVAIEKLAWTSALVRAPDISVQDGRYCKTGDKTRLYVGSFVTTSTTTTEDSQARPFLFNAYHASARRHIGDGVESNTLTTSSSTYVVLSGSLNTSIFLGLPQVVDVSMKTSLHNLTDDYCDAFIGVQVDGGTTYTVDCSTCDKFGFYIKIGSTVPVPMAAGLHTLGFMWKMAGASALSYDGGSRGASIGATTGTAISCVIVR